MGQVSHNSSIVDAIKVPKYIAFPMKEWARILYLNTCGDDFTGQEQMHLHEWVRKDLKMVEYLRHLSLQIFPDAEWDLSIEEEKFFSMEENLVAHVTVASYYQKVVQATHPEESTRLEEKKSNYWRGSWTQFFNPN